MITEGQKQQIKAVLQSPQWPAVEELAKEMQENIRSESSLRQTQWETLQTTIFKEGRLKGISEFLQELYKQAQNEQIRDFSTSHKNYIGR